MYYSQIRVDPRNPETVYVGGLNFSKSTDGGKTFRSLQQGIAHVDNHAIWINPANSDHLLVGNDGVLHRTDEHLPVGQGLAGRAIAENRFLIADDYPTWPDRLDEWVQMGVTTCMASPVRRNGIAVGSLIALSWEPGRRFTEDEQHLLQSLAEHGSLAFNDASALEVIQRSLERAVFDSNHDQLTGLAHERGIKGNILNRPLPPGTGGDAWRRVVERDVLPAIDLWRPQLIFISAGFDAHAEDPLANMALFEEDFIWVTRELCTLADRHCDGKIVSVLEGGYDPAALARSVVAHLKVLAEERS